MHTSYLFTGEYTLVPEDKWQYWDPDKEPITAPKKYYNIAICTTCMNRTHDLERTLPVNILNNIDYPGVQFVILDYNSADHLDKWMQTHMLPYIKSGIVKYIHTTEPEKYKMGHSRNIAFKAADADIVNNVDADNYIGHHFVHAINDLANICPAKAVFSKGKKLIHGRLGLYKDEFMELGGYDESMIGYGADDKDLMHRALASGYKLMWWNKLGDFMNRIRTPRSEVDKYMEGKWKETEEANKKIAADNLSQGNLTVNKNKPWGKAKLVVNFEQEIEV